MHGVRLFTKNGHYLVALLPGFAYLEELGMSGPLMVRLFIGVDKLDKSKLMCPDNMTHAGICRTQMVQCGILAAFTLALCQLKIAIDEEHAVPMR